VVSENTETTEEWLDFARRAFQSTYGYEWQGDNLLLAREALLYTFIEYYINKFNVRDTDGKIIVKNTPKRSSIQGIARIISWNLWQMDGIKMVVPDSCDKVYEDDLFGRTKLDCPACRNGKTFGHIGVPCIIRDWNIKTKPEGWKLGAGEDPKSQPWQKLKFYTLLLGNQEDTEDNEDNN
jgi:hypothetical protein